MANCMNRSSLILSVATLVGLTDCSTPATIPALSGSRERITRFSHPDVNEAAGAFVFLYTNTINESVSQQKYQEHLAYKHLSAEACFDSRANRLLNRPVSQMEKEELILSHVSPEKLEQYRILSRGYFNRINALEMLTCDTAGLKQDPNQRHY